MISVKEVAYSIWRLIWNLLWRVCTEALMIPKHGSIKNGGCDGSLSLTFSSPSSPRSVLHVVTLNEVRKTYNGTKGVHP